MTTASSLEETGDVIGVRGGPHVRGWLKYVVERRMDRSLSKAHAKRAAGAYAHVAPQERARSVVRWACAKAAFTGAVSGATTTAAVVATAETEGIAGIVTLPVAAAVVGVEMVARTVIHVDLACELAEIFGVRLEGADDMARLLSLRAAPAGDEEEDELGRGKLEDVTGGGEARLEHAALTVLGESVLKNLLPFVGIVSSVATNIVVTRRLGQMLRRAFRYERAMVDILRGASATCAPYMDLLIEGLWFVFTADGRLSPEETACLAQRLDDLDEAKRREVIARFTADESNWLERLQSVPDEARDTFLRVLEIAVALDKSVVLPEEKILRRVAEVFQRPYDARQIERIVAELERRGVVS